MTLVFKKGTMPTVSELKAELKARGLPTHGKKHELEERLQTARSFQFDRQPPPSKGGDAKRARTTVTTPPTSGSGAVGSSSPSKSNSLFDSLSGGMDVMDAEKTLAFCEQLGVDPEAFTAVVLSYYLRSPSMGTFEKAAFSSGAAALGITSVENLKSKLPLMEKKCVFGGSEFDNVYKFVYSWGCEPGIRNMKKDVAIGLWKLLIPPSAYSLIDDWLAYWEASPARVVTKDEWLSFKRYVDLARTSKSIMIDSDDAWPTAIDEFVETIQKKQSSSSS